MQTFVSAGKIGISWAASKGAVKYRVEVLNYSTKVVVANQYVTTTSFVFNSAADGVKYDFHIYAIAADGTESSYGRSVYGYALPKAPNKIYLYNWKPGTNKPYIEWNKTDDSLYFADGYQVKIMTLAGKKVKTCNVSARYINTAFSKIKNAGFKVQIRGYINIDVNGRKTTVYGLWSKPKAFVAQPSPSSTRRYSESKTTLKWTKIKNAKSYTIYKVTGSTNNYKFKKYKTVKGTSIKVKKNSGKYAIYANVKVKGKTYKGTYKTSEMFYYTTAF